MGCRIGILLGTFIYDIIYLFQLHESVDGTVLDDEEDVLDEAVVGSPGGRPRCLLLIVALRGFVAAHFQVKLFVL